MSSQQPPPAAAPDDNGSSGNDESSSRRDSASELRDHLANLASNLKRKDSTLETSSGSEGEEDNLLAKNGNVSRKVSREEQPARKSKQILYPAAIFHELRKG